MEGRQQLGPYRLVERIAQGGMGEVWLGRVFGASGFEAPVALKVLRAALRGDAELERLLIDEARRGAGLRHRNLIAVHDLGCDDGIYFVRMEYVAGCDLASALRRARLAPALAAFVAEEVALALAYVHAAADPAGRPLGLVHRDVSPSNVLVSRHGEVKLGDLGVAKATRLADVTRANVHKGKYAYMSPEQVAGAPIGPGSDQFALGVVLAEMLTGERPFDGATPIETMERVRAAAAPELPGVPARLADVVRRCLSPEPAARFHDATLLYAALREARAGLGDAGPPELAAWLASLPAA